MRLLIIHSYYYPDVKGGAEYSIKKLAEGLTGRGHEVHVLCDNPSGDMDDTVNGVFVHRRAMCCLRESPSIITKIERAVTELYNRRNRKIIQDVIDAVCPDVVYTNCLEHISPIAWRVVKKRGIKIVDTQRVYILLEMAGGKYKVGNNLWKSVNRKMSELVDETAFISYFTKDKFLSEGFFRNANHSVIYNSIDYDELSVKERIHSHISKADCIFHCIYLGSLAEHKGVLTLLKAFSQIESDTVRLHFAGDGPLKDQVLNAAKNDPRIVFHGWLDETAMNALLDQCDAVICPSIWPEPFGRVVLDAYKHGLPVIASRSGGLAETVEDGMTGIQVTTANVKELTDAIERLRSDHNFYIHCCSNIYDKLQQFGLENYLNRFEELFNKALS